MINLCLPVSCSDAVWEGEVVLLQVSHQGPAVDLAADTLLHHLPPVELQAGVHRLYAHRGQVSTLRNPDYRTRIWSHVEQEVVTKSFVRLRSYAEVRAEQRRELGIEESPPEMAPDKVVGRVGRTPW